MIYRCFKREIRLQPDGIAAGWSCFWKNSDDLFHSLLQQEWNITEGMAMSQSRMMIQDKDMGLPVTESQRKDKTLSHEGQDEYSGSFRELLPVALEMKHLELCSKVFGETLGFDTQ